MNAIEINNISKHYKGFSLENVSFLVPTGTIMGLVGENGAGKSTIIGILLGLKNKQTGTVKILGEDSTEHIKEDIGVVLDECCFHGCLNALKVDKIIKKAFKSWSSEEFLSLVKRLSLPLDKEITNYSKGMKMKLSIAAGLAHSPKLLILDEPTSGLDPLVRDELNELFLDFVSDGQHSILISSHIISDLEKICDNITFIHKGKILLSEATDTLINSYSVIKYQKDDIINSQILIGTRKTPAGIEALVRREDVPQNVKSENASLEDIIIFTSKGGEVK